MVKIIVEVQKVEPIIKDWIVRYYDKKDKQIGSHVIKDRTEHEAENEAIADMPLECEDWTMVAK
jgi:hypothetical protein